MERDYTNVSFVVNRISKFQPLQLGRFPEPFSHQDWLFEIKYDGFRALAHIEHGR